MVPEICRKANTLARSFFNKHGRSHAGRISSRLPPARSAPHRSSASMHARRKTYGIRWPCLGQPLPPESVCHGPVQYQRQERIPAYQHVLDPSRQSRIRYLYGPGCRNSISAGVSMSVRGFCVEPSSASQDFTGMDIQSIQRQRFHFL